MSCVTTTTATNEEWQKKRKIRCDTFSLLSLSLPLDRWNTAFVIILLLLKLLFCRMIEASGGPVLFCFILHCCSFIAYSRELERTHTHIHTIILILIENERQSIMNDSIFSVGYYSTQYVCVFLYKFRIVWLWDKLLHGYIIPCGLLSCAFLQKFF